MNWDEVWELGVAPELAGDSEIQSVVGDAIYLAGTRKLEVPSVTALFLVDSEEENWAPAEWQFDVYAKTTDAMRLVARRIRALLHHEVQFELGPFLLWGEFLTGHDMSGPDSDGFFRYSMDFRFTPGRSLYLTAQES